MNFERVRVVRKTSDFVFTVLYWRVPFVAKRVQITNWNRLVNANDIRLFRAASFGALSLLNRLPTGRRVSFNVSKARRTGHGLFRRGTLDEIGASKNRQISNDKRNVRNRIGHGTRRTGWVPNDEWIVDAAIGINGVRVHGGRALRGINKQRTNARVIS